MWTRQATDLCAGMADGPESGWPQREVLGRDEWDRLLAITEQHQLLCLRAFRAVRRGIGFPVGDEARSPLRSTPVTIGSLPEPAERGRLGMKRLAFSNVSTETHTDE